jgi:small subunit ribosomal protein S8e
MRKSIENLSGRKFTGGRKVAMRGRRKFEIDRYPSEALFGENQTRMRRVRGNNKKIAVKSGAFVNLSDPVSRKTTNSKILQVVKNPANKDYERRGVISKGAMVQTEAGMARVVSRPGQDGCINAVLIKQ